MKKCTLCLSFLAFLLIFTGCNRVPVRPSDELMMTERWAQSASGIKASLKFYDNIGEFSVIFPDNTEPVTIKGYASADDKMFYITVQEYGKTYAFSYKMYGIKAQIKYCGETLDFYPADKFREIYKKDLEN